MNLSLIIKAVVVALAIIIGFATPMLLKKKDTPVEQFAESIIKEETGIDIDFSPEE